MARTLLVFGATGQQGNSLIQYVLQDPKLSQEYKIRAITRNPSSDAAKQLKEKVEVVQGDVFDRASLESALTGVHTVFAMTNPSFTPDGLEVEYNAGKTIADVAVAKGVQYIIFSTLPAVKKISGGKYTKVTHFDAKAEIEQYIRGLDIKSAFFSPAFFMQNYETNPFLGPQRDADGDWVMVRINSPHFRMPMVDTVGNTGNFIGAILAEPDKFEGKTFCAATATNTLEDTAAIISKATGQNVRYKQVPVEEWKKSLPFGQDAFVETFSFLEEFGYWGPESESSVEWAAKNARGRLTTFKEYLEAHPLRLK